jgi:hypothetical protein
MSWRIKTMMRQKTIFRLFMSAGVAMLGFIGASPAQVAPAVSPPFFGGPVTAFDIEVSIIDSGRLLDAQAVVSNDQRYVTINARADNSGLLALQQFRTQTATVGGAGFVGGVDPSGKLEKTALEFSPAAGSPSDIDRAGHNATSVLNRRGVFLLTPLK